MLTTTYMDFPFLLMKWLYKINALAEPSLGPVQSQEYIYYTSQIGKQNVMYSNGFSIQNMPVSYVCLPSSVVSD